MRRPYHLLAHGALALLLLAPAHAAAQKAAAPTPEQPAEPEPEPETTLTATVGAAGTAQAELREIEQASAPSQRFLDLVQKTPELSEGLKERATTARQLIEAATQLRQIEDLRNRWVTQQEQLEGVRDQLNARALALQESLKRIDEITATWEKSRNEAREVKAPKEVLTQIGNALKSAKQARKTVDGHSAEVLKLQADVGGALGVVADVLERAREIRRQEGAAMLAFTQQEAPEIVLHATLLVLAVLAGIALRPRAQRWAAEDETAGVSAALLARPYAAGILIAALASPFLYPTAPSNWEELFLLIGLLASLRLLPQLLEKEIRPAFYALAIFFVFDRVRDLLTGTPLLARVILMVELLGFAGILMFLLPTRRLSLLPNAATRLAIFLFAKRVWLGLIGVAFLSGFFGFENLSTLIGNGVMFSTYGAVAIYAGYKVLAGMVGVGLRSRIFSSVRVIDGHREGLRHGITRILRWAAVIGWIAGALGLFRIRESVIAFLVRVLESGISVGQLSVSIGGVLVFVLAVLVAIYSARLVRYVLDEDVLPRLSLPRGVPYAISSMSFYTLLVLGFMAAVAAAGIDLSGLALLGGALGVGIGFGLQNVVNNFVSGLILLFERPIQSGDTIEIGTLFGEVRQIGIRASTVRTWQGAEVIVPNANLISDQVVNWTLSDRNRRIEIEVGVKYGTDPERVIEILRGVAAAEERVISPPEPNALFLGFGESSLDFQLRAWTSRSDEWMRIKSSLNIAINRALAEAGIEIPFPQRDLHLRSVDEAAGRALAPDRDRS
jgi:small-conductance mechanosensitive channel